MKILHISAHLGDGAGKAIVGLSASDKKNKYTCYLLDEPRKLKWVDFAVENNIDVFWKRNERFDALISEADVVVFNWWECKATLEFLAVWKTIKAKRKIIWSHQNGLYPEFPDGLFETVDKFLVTTPLTIKKYPRIGTLENSLVYGFGDFQIENYIPKKDYEVSETLNILYVGVCSYKRFPDNALEYFKAIIKMNPSVKFTMFGEYSLEFKNDIETSEISRYIELKGWSNDVTSKISEYDIGLYIVKDEISSTTENSIIENMSSALPIVISKNLPYNYLLEDGVSGFFASNPDEFAEKIHMLFNNENLRRNIGQNARKYCREKYSSAKNLQVFLKACEREND